MAEKGEEKVIAAATDIFVRYGYKRVTMGEIAEAAGMSRPALYLVFPSKADILRSVIAHIVSGLLAEIRQGINGFATVEDKLTFAFDVWCVRGFEIMKASPDAKDLYESSLQFAGQVTADASAEFVAILADVLEPLVKRQTRVDLSAVQIALVLAGAMPGFKLASKTSDQYRGMIANLITVVLASLNNPEEARSRHLDIPRGGRGLLP